MRFARLNPAQAAAFMGLAPVAFNLPQPAVDIGGGPHVPSSGTTEWCITRPDGAHVLVQIDDSLMDLMSDDTSNGDAGARRAKRLGRMNAGQIVALRNVLSNVIDV